MTASVKDFRKTKKRRMSVSVALCGNSLKIDICHVAVQKARLKGELRSILGVEVNDFLSTLVGIDHSTHVSSAPHSPVIS